MANTALVVGGAVGLALAAVLASNFVLEEEGVPETRRTRDAKAQKKREQHIRKGLDLENRAERLEEKAAKAATNARKRRDEAQDIYDSTPSPSNYGRMQSTSSRVVRIDEIADRLRRGDYTASDLKGWTHSATLHLKNPGEPTTYDQACSMANAEAKQCGVAVLTAAEQKRYGLPQYAIAVGPLEQISYERDGVIYDHKAGDVGGAFGQKASTSVLVADPRDGRPAIIPGRMKFSGGWLRG